MSERRAPWEPAPWDHAGQCKAITQNYIREALSAPPYDMSALEAALMSTALGAFRIR